MRNEDEANLWSADLFLYEDTMSSQFKDRKNRYFDLQLPTDSDTQRVTQLSM